MPPILEYTLLRTVRGGEKEGRKENALQNSSCWWNKDITSTTITTYTNTTVYYTKKDGEARFGKPRKINKYKK
ncbi:hypothetical protein Pcinc_031833 [Petrolisthes cinctipes]|uniref:Uncharacterized protein n=1 Tax=Petrolisthes cinctipes TaxID=88211 RepID=A0AAE1K494_PETCI|nr:hypothetical protein Pcinc_031833 [Petrolisthes cinctipes]